VRDATSLLIWIKLWIVRSTSHFAQKGNAPGGNVSPSGSQRYRTSARDARRQIVAAAGFVLVSKDDATVVGTRLRFSCSTDEIGERSKKITERS
jgi:hypothetical protein